MIVAILAAIVLAVFLFCGREIPQNPIASPGSMFTSPLMMVSPDGNSGNSQSSNNSDQQTEQQEQIDQLVAQMQNQQTQNGQSAQSQNQEGNGSSTSGGGSTANGGSGSSGNPTTGPETGQLGIETNLGRYVSIDATTAAPNFWGITFQDRSGWDSANGILYFYAMPNERANAYSVRVTYSNDLTGGVTRTLTGDNNIYSMQIPKNNGAQTKVNITLMTPGGAPTQYSVDYTLTYQGRKAPTVVVNVEEGQQIDTDSFNLSVAATDADNAAIYSDHIQVYIDGVQITNHSAQPPYIYGLNLASLAITGDQTPHVITVVATDYSADAATTTLTRNIVYVHHATGEQIGTATVVIDASAVDLGVVDTISVPIHSGWNFCYDMYQALTNAGYNVDIRNSVADVNDPESNWGNFWLNRISGGSLGSNLHLDPKLLLELECDKVSYNNYTNGAGLGSYDFGGSVSGWVYTTNRDFNPSTSFGALTVTDGEQINLIYTVAGGKEFGMSFAQNGGRLSSYCITWSNGVAVWNHNPSVYQIVEPATCQHEGKACYVCKAEWEYDASFGVWDNLSSLDWNSTMTARAQAFGSSAGNANCQFVTVPVTGHNWVLVEEDSILPTETEPGQAVYRCTSGGETTTVVWPVGQDTPPVPEN